MASGDYRSRILNALRPQTTAAAGGGVYAKVPSAPQTTGAPMTPGMTDPRTLRLRGAQQPYNAAPANQPQYGGAVGPYMTSQRSPGGQGATPGMANVRTSIQPETLYNASDTAHQMAAQAAQFNNDPNYVQKQFARPGRSMDAGTLSQAAPQMAQAGAGMLRTLQQVPFGDAMANNRFLLSGQVAQGQEGLGLANILRRLQGVNDYEQNDIVAQLMGLLGG